MPPLPLITLLHSTSNWHQVSVQQYLKDHHDMSQSTSESKGKGSESTPLCKSGSLSMQEGYGSFESKVKEKDKSISEKPWKQKKVIIFVMDFWTGDHVENTISHALYKGHAVTVYARHAENPSITTFKNEPNDQLITGGYQDEESLRNALTGQDVVISFICPYNWRQRILTDSYLDTPVEARIQAMQREEHVDFYRRLCRAMAKANVSRLYVESHLYLCELTGDNLGWWRGHKRILKLKTWLGALQEIYDVLRNLGTSNSIEWTLCRFAERYYDLPYELNSFQKLLHPDLYSEKVTEKPWSTDDLYVGLVGGSDYRGTILAKQIAGWLIEDLEKGEYSRDDPRSTHPIICRISKEQ
ncbi:hypothetical protein BT63DRAFT_411333 [Microthyrium microscopicum]|uniref:NAD(P)-binding domain-containing protein n=1 Tax=Microthyrium microscopicum TaxID=703497 RepID=A0A6A6UIA0_9PEZI|nr:hypothetical protein BT63DRAFT_411333 [Microthyrium microscopicum]